MRVTTPLLYTLGVDSINRQQESLLKLQQQIALGRRIMTPSDDPIGAAQALTVTQTKARTAQHVANVGEANDALAHSESVLGQVTDLLQSVRTTALAAGGPALSDADRRSLATDLRSQLAQLVGLANSKGGDGTFMFAGFATDTQPFADATGSIVYSGDSGLRMLEVGPGRTLPISASGDDLFMRIRNGNGAFVTSPAAANTGTGIVTPGSVVDPTLVTGDTYEIRINVAAGVTTYDVVDTTTAAVVSAGNPYTSGSAITVAGMQVTLSGAPANNDRFTLAPSSSQSVFTTISNLIATVEAGAATPLARTQLANGLNRGLSDVDQALEHMLSARADMGAGLRELETLASGYESQQVMNDQTLSRLQDLDYNAALSDFARQQLALEAAQKSFIQITGLSLFDYL